MKSRLLKIISLFLMVYLLFSGCAKTKKEVVVEPKNEPILQETPTEEIVKPDLKVEIKEEPAVVKEEKIEEKQAEVVLEVNEQPIKDKAEEKTALSVCSLIVRCDDVLKNSQKLKEEKKSIIPPDGIIYEDNEVSFEKGESVFDVLNRKLKENNIHFEFVDTPMYNSKYIEGIGNLYEFDCGSLSGWMYRVNGIKPNVGCSQYTVKNGDKIEFYYTCNFMEDNE